MRTVMRWLGWLILGGCLLLVGTALFFRIAGPGAAARAALALLQDADPVEAGRNAFASLWLIEYDVPAQQRDALAAQDIDALIGADTDQPQWPGQSLGVGFKRLAGLRDDPPLCDRAHGDCLAMVRQGREAYAAMLARDRALVERIRALAAFDRYRTPPSAQTDVPLPPLPRLFAGPTASALDFVEGRVDPALESTCREVETWRRLGANSDSLVVSMLAAGLVRIEVRLFADMLAELPSDHPLPAACGVAFDPARIAPDLCPAMRGEARLMMAAAGGAGASENRLKRALLYDVDATRALLAPAYARGCSVAMRQALSNGGELPPAPPPVSRWQPSCLGNLVGCLLARIGTPDFDLYFRRAQDGQALLHATETLLRLRSVAAGSGRSVAELLAADGLAWDWAPAYRPQFDAQAGELVVPMRGYQDIDAWRIPLPASRRGSGASTEIAAGTEGAD